MTALLVAALIAAALVTGASVSWRVAVRVMGGLR